MVERKTWRLVDVLPPHADSIGPALSQLSSEKLTTLEPCSRLLFYARTNFSWLNVYAFCMTNLIHVHNNNRLFQDDETKSKFVFILSVKLWFSAFFSFKLIISFFLNREVHVIKTNQSCNIYQIHCYLLWPCLSSHTFQINWNCYGFSSPEFLVFANKWTTRNEIIIIIIIIIN